MSSPPEHFLDSRPRTSGAPGTQGMRILVAGLTGQVGQGLLEACHASGDDAPSVIGLVRRRPRAAHIMGESVTQQVVGDVRSAGWGLSETDLDQLGEIDAVLNLSGATDWTASHAALDQVNVLGAVHGLDLSKALSERLGRPVPYLSASSVFVAGLSDGVVVEDLLPPNVDRTPYELSKWTAERALMARARRTDHPLALARVGGVVGNSLTARTTRRSSLYQLVSRREEDKRLRVLPAQRGARVDTLPRDVIGESLLRMLGQGRRNGFADWRSGTIAQVAAGERAPTLAALLAQLESMDTGSRYCVPRLVPASRSMLEMVTRVGTRYVRWSRQTGNRLHGLRYVTVDRVFERTRFAGLTGGWLPAVPLETILRVTFDLHEQHPTAPVANLPLGRFQ
ncbi:SDR family oxidoreductase [Streptomyces sp. H27-D2]|uniref:SDR family oxidoreductase n=1 Tax=Streptomyces sp. H27-D2 TaxID=3046304 RepID=UPI002DC0271F|nr:SDR family oxidoreductase [Streptomyces sp. H27-D2]MEC4015029.1 SDR family oxidoreductase [Streptomyces sp. H27-D2]